MFEKIDDYLTYKRTKNLLYFLFILALLQSVFFLIQIPQVMPIVLTITIILFGTLILAVRYSEKLISKIFLLAFVLLGAFGYYLSTKRIGRIDVIELIWNLFVLVLLVRLYTIKKENK